MATTSLIVNTKDTNDKALQKTITNVNAACSSGTLKTFSQMLNGLTSNTYVKTDRVDKSNVDTESTGSTGATTARSINIQATQYVAEQQKNTLDAVNNDATEVNILFPLTGNVITFRFNDTDVDRIPSFSSIVANGDGMSVVNKSQAHYESTHNMEVMRNTWEMSLTISDATVGSITVTLEIPASDTYAAYSRTLTFNLVDSI